MEHKKYEILNLIKLDRYEYGYIRLEESTENSNLFYALEDKWEVIPDNRLRIPYVVGGIVLYYKVVAVRRKLKKVRQNHIEEKLFEV